MNIENITQIIYDETLQACKVLFYVDIFLYDERNNSKRYQPGSTLNTSIENGHFIESLLDENDRPYMTQTLNHLTPKN